MKIKQKNKTGLTFGEFVTAAYQNCGARRAAYFVQLAIHSRQVIFQKQPTNQPGGLMSRIKIVPKVALLAVVLGCASFVNGGSAAEVVIGVPDVAVVVPAPPIVVVPAPGFFLFGGPYDGRRDARDYGRRGAESRGGDHRGGGRRR